MRPQFGFVLLTAGLVTGFVAARLVGGGGEAASEDIVRQRDAAAARADRAEAELAAVRDAKKRVRSEETGPKGEVPPDTRVPSDPAPAAAPKDAAAAAAEKQAAARARLRTARDGVQAALAAKDGAKVLALLKELAAIAR